MLVRCLFADECEWDCCHRDVHDSDLFLSNCDQRVIRCKLTREKVICQPTSKRMYFVNVGEVYIQPYKVLASSDREAIEIVARGGGEIMEGQLEYSHRLDPEFWTVEQIPVGNEQAKPVYCPHCIWYGDECRPDAEDWEEPCDRFEPSKYSQYFCQEE